MCVLGGLAVDLMKVCGVLYPVRPHQACENCVKAKALTDDLLVLVWLVERGGCGSRGGVVFLLCVSCRDLSVFFWEGPNPSNGEFRVSWVRKAARTSDVLMWQSCSWSPTRVLSAQAADGLTAAVVYPGGEGVVPV